MKILVAGSSGFIGSHLTPKLVERGHQVIGFDLHEPTGDYGISGFVQGDIRRKDDLVAALEGVDAAVNLAAIHFDYGHEDHEYWETNEAGTQAFLDAMEESGVQRFLFTSSIAVYGDRADEASETTEPTPTSVYGASKLGGEHVIEKWVDGATDRSVVIIRPCVVFGERNVTNMNNLIRQIDSGFFVMFGKGENVKATAYVENLAAAICMQVESMEPGLLVFNYADKPDLQVKEIVSVIRTALGKSSTAPTFPLWLGLLAAKPFDFITKITGKNLPVSSARVQKLTIPTQVAAQKIRDAGYQQPVATEEGLRRMVKYFSQSKRSESQ